MEERFLLLIALPPWSTARSELARWRWGSRDTLSVSHFTLLLLVSVVRAKAASLLERLLAYPSVCLGRLTHGGPKVQLFCDSEHSFPFFCVKAAEKQ